MDGAAVYRRIGASVYPSSMNKTFQALCGLVFLTLMLGACRQGGVREVAAPMPDGAARAWFDGDYANHEQVTRAGAGKVPQVRFTVAPQPGKGWYVWTTQMTGDVELSATWALRTLKSGDGSLTLTPYRALVAQPGRGKDFDPDQWLALDACALHGSSTAAGMQVRAEASSCATVAPGIGREAALLPLEIDHDGELMHVRLYADQARGADARIEARRVHWFSGWAALNGAGPNASADSKDWHMNRELRLGSEGGSVHLNWRDGQASGYSLRMERMTYRDGNVPVLKLSLIEDASGKAMAYAWANPEATRIGLSLGWVQVGLERSAAESVR